MQKITVAQLMPYLPYSLRAIHKEVGLINIYGINIPANKVLNIIGESTLSIDDVKPILRPLSDFNNSNAYIEINEFHTIEYDNGSFRDEISEAFIGGFPVEFAPYKVVEVLLKHHFDIFYLLNKNLAVSIHSIK